MHSRHCHGHGAPSRLSLHRRRSVTIAFPPRTTVTVAFLHNIATSICMRHHRGGSHASMSMEIESREGACYIRFEGQQMTQFWLSLVSSMAVLVT
ncbi:hypothetical protein SESBI_11479 [Sesbania bispinosa]|nr:hypothetical protein SESBI_11479 [Sesbania bispinosa]